MPSELPTLPLPPIHPSLRVVAHTARPAKNKMRVTAPEYGHPLLSQLSESLEYLA